eukprot:GHVS01085664.1.p1 GENE.GHVS01085664.1~~GHVS01085664.1.p1  ORF type:complete len:451 (+),score=75.79 GHVS01085664.1:68-1420(+)
MVVQEEECVGDTVKMSKGRSSVLLLFVLSGALCFALFYGISLQYQSLGSRWGEPSVGQFKKVMQDESAALKGVQNEVLKLQRKILGRVKQLSEEKKEGGGALVDMAELQKKILGGVEQLAEAKKEGGGALVDMAELQKKILGGVEQLSEAKKEAGGGLVDMAKEGGVGLAFRESLKYYENITGDSWRLRKEKFYLQRSRQDFIGTSDNETGNSWFQNHWEPEWACELEERIGRMGDGGKWVCDVSRIPANNCLVYSIGSNNELSFEEDLFERRQCKIITIDHTTEDSVKPSFVQFFPWGLSPPPGENLPVETPKDKGLIDLNGLIELSGQSDRTIDVLKIDIESAEYATLLPLLVEGAKRRKAGTKQVNGEKPDRRAWRHWPPIRQVLIEIHIGAEHAVGRAEDAKMLLRAFADNGYVVFHKEANIIGCGGRCTEYSLLLLDIPEQPQAI